MKLRTALVVLVVAILAGAFIGLAGAALLDSPPQYIPSNR